jgi:hypothetical protein
MVQWLGFPSAEIAFVPDERRAGQSKYTLRRLLRLAGDGLFSFSRAPLRAAFYVGLLAIVAGLVHSLWIGVLALFGHEATANSLAYLLIASQLFSGATLAVLGVLGEYIGRIHEQVKNRPLYVLNEYRRPAASALRVGPPAQRGAA